MFEIYFVFCIFVDYELDYWNVRKIILKWDVKNLILVRKYDCFNWFRCGVECN